MSFEIQKTQTQTQTQESLDLETLNILKQIPKTAKVDCKEGIQDITKPPNVDETGWCDS